jgi:flagellar biosynthetic protein FliO
MDFIQSLPAVLLVFVLLGGALWLLRRRGGASFHLPSIAKAQTRQMHVVERVALNAQHALHLVRVGDRTLVVATSPSTCGLIAEVER